MYFATQSYDFFSSEAFYKKALKVQSEIVPLLSEIIIEDHQSGFVGKKNQEEKRDK